MIWLNLSSVDALENRIFYYIIENCIGYQDQGQCLYLHLKTAKMKRLGKTNWTARSMTSTRCHFYLSNHLLSRVTEIKWKTGDFEILRPLFKVCVFQKELCIYTPRCIYPVSYVPRGHQVWHWSVREATATPKATRNLYLKAFSGP